MFILGRETFSLIVVAQSIVSSKKRDRMQQDATAQQLFEAAL
jgi:hypothetical protein